MPRRFGPRSPNDPMANTPPPEDEIFAPTDEADGDDGPDWVDDEGAERRRIVITREEPKRIDVFLFKRIKSLSRNRVQKLIALGGVTLNGQPPKPSTQIREGDVIDVILPPPAVREIKPEYIPISVLFEDDHMLVLNKQANLIVHPARGNVSGTLLNGLAYRFMHGDKPPADPDVPVEEGGIAGLSSVGAGDFRPGIVHRLDRNTTGVMVIAKSDETHWRIASQFEKRTNLKAYLAVVHGNIDQAGGVIEQPLGKHPTIREAYAVRHDSTGKDSVTLFRVREQYKGFCLVELELKTGRTHQIRVHLSHMGYPIAGDLIYGGEPVGHHELDHPPIAAGSRKLINFARAKGEGEKLETDSRQRDDLIMVTPALHASLLGLWHPIEERDLRFQAPLHEPMATLVRELRKRPADLAKYPVATEGYHLDLAELVPDSEPIGDT